MPFAYKTVLVVGATSGIGLALSEKMLSEGVTKIIALGRRQDKLDDLQQKHGESKVSTVKFDITNLDGIPEMVERVLKSHPALDCAFLNSGIQRSLDFTEPESIDLEVISSEFTTNYLSYVHLTKALLPHLQKRAKGGEDAGLIFTTSGLALVPILRCGNYCASKAAMHHLILVMREQLRDLGEKDDDNETGRERASGIRGNKIKGVKVIEIYPPSVQTELHDEKHQPDIKNGRSIGMPLDEFTEEAWRGLERGDEDIPVGTTLRGFGYEVVEMGRKRLFGEMMEKMKG
ncbi:911f46ec-7fd7-409e-bc1f-18b551df2505 [Sclerotinia trifoliorum]|uniref:911f46ec-7fd7-409e-bc1f-18b551df2505 n=1 Tax=Sclerotinia trifoliorum TaxID=28548 RepID=A0A8H2ZKJ2_9HELO|nr:911f46ec-7fd7-409e-bc1f-18b551df2505 [Sclerotinia trifoliorum]